MDQLDGSEAISENVDDANEDSPLKSPVSIDPADVWGGHLNKEKVPVRSKQSAHASQRSASKKRQSHSSIFSKLLANDVSLFVPPVKSARQIAEPVKVNRDASSAKSVPDGKALKSRAKIDSRSTDVGEPSASPFYKSQGSSVFSGPRKSVFMRRLGDTSLSEASPMKSTLHTGEIKSLGIKSPEMKSLGIKSAEIKSPGIIKSPEIKSPGIKSPESALRSGSWEAFSSDEQPDVADSTFEMVKKSDRLSSFGASLLRSGNADPKPRKAARKVIALTNEVNAGERSSLTPKSSVRLESSVELSKSAAESKENDQETFSRSISGPKPAGERGSEREIKPSKVENTNRSGDHDRPRFSPLSGSRTNTIEAAGVSELSNAWNRRVVEDAPSMHNESTAEESVKRKRSETVAVEASDDPKPKAKRAKTVGGGGGGGGSSAVSENYVRVNLKKKKFVRGAKTMTGGKYKRQQWKQRMKARGQVGGGGCGDTDKCFKCGETGHWASKCTGKAKSGIDNELMSLKEKMETAESKDDDTFPTMEDAADMARGVSYKAKNSKVSSIYPEATKKKKKMTSVSVVSADPENKQVEAYRYNFSDSDDDESSWQLKEDQVINEPSSSQNGRATMNPVFQMQDGKLPETPPAVWNALKTFGYSSFRPGQEEAVMRILCGQSTLVILSTGAGKSLCYKLPAYLYGTRKQALTVVISPLVSLMEDQVASLPPGVVGACLHTNMTPGQRQKVAQSVYDNQVHFLLMSPESLVGGGNNSGIVNFSRMPPVAFVCIDEAHCLSEWSHHFRPSYLRVCKVLREQLNVTCMLGLTATATMTTAVSVGHHLGIADFKSAFIRGVPFPPNLVLSVSKDERRSDALINLLQGDRFKDLNSIIIYCTRRQETEQIATRIRTCLGDKSKPKPKGRAKKYTKQASDEPLDWDAEPYHAGLSPSARKRVQNLFMSGRLKVVVATVAFGMGLDKADVRSVIHYNLPKTFESYVQEIGRAGRDGQPAHCHLFLDKNDLCELKKHTYGNTVDRYVLKKFVRMVFPVCKCRVIEQQCGNGSDDSEPESTPQTTPGQRLCHGHQRAVPIDTSTNSLDVREEGIGTLLCYLELHPDRWLENHRPTYATCNVRCYGGQTQFKEMARSCPPIAAAVAWSVKSGVKPTNQITFPVVEIADMMGWDAGPVKRELYSLQWTTGGSGSRKSGVLVEFSDLAFHFRSPGDLTGDELDQVTDFLHDRVQSQERAEIHGLKRLFETLSKVAFRDYSRCCDTVCEEKSQWLRQQLLDYFDEPPTQNPATITVLSFAREMEADTATAPEESSEQSSRDNYQLLSDIHSFLNTYSSEHTLTGRAIARVFQGIGSPCFPTEVWGKVRRFWRSHLSTDFNQIRMMATRELIKFR